MKNKLLIFLGIFIFLILPKNVYADTNYTITYLLNDEEYLSYEVSEHGTHQLYDYSVPEGFSFSGWSYDPSVNLNDITSNITIFGTLTEIIPEYKITQTDFYTLLVLLSVLILMLFLKWCFPYRFGSDLK